MSTTSAFSIGIEGLAVMERSLDRQGDSQFIPVTVRDRFKADCQASQVMEATDG